MTYRPEPRSLLPVLVLSAVVALLGCGRKDDPTPATAAPASTEAASADACCPPEAVAPAVDPAGDDHAGYDHGPVVVDDDHAEPEHGSADDDHAGHDHGGPSDLDSSPQELLARRCEHDIETFACDECRYEVGVVKADRALFDSGRLFELSSAVRRPRTEGRRLNGEVRLDESGSAWITPRASGVVRRIQVDLGSRVRRGQVLFEVESGEFAAARAEYLRAGAALTAAEASFARESELFERRVCPKKDLIEAQSARDEARASARAAEEILRQFGLSSSAIASVSEEGAVATPAWMPVTTPFDGTILDRALSVGATVVSGDRLLLLGDLARVWVVASAHQDDLAGLLDGGEGRRAMVTVQAYPGRSFPGRVERISGVLDEQTRTASVRVVVDNPQGLLRPGMFARVEVMGGDGGDALAVPSESVLEDEGRTFVFVPVEEPYFIRRPVVAGPSRDGWTEIAAGLQPGQPVVGRGAFLMKSDVLRSKMGAGCAD